MNCIVTPLIGRWGNKLFQYAHARAYAEQHGLELRTPAWEGEQLFAGVPVTKRPDGTEQVLGGYGQRQQDLIYSRSQVKRWFAWKPEVEYQLEANTHPFHTVAHLRRGDYQSLGYVVVSQRSYEKACLDFGLLPPVWMMEENCNPWLNDFYTMQQSRVLIRANSSFSWWAATLSNGQVYSPIIEGLEGGKEQDCQFVRGNWPKLHNLDITTDLLLPDTDI